MSIGWPEGIILGLIGLSLLMKAALDGEPRKDRHSLAGGMLDAIILLGLLYWGGFFA